MYYSGPVSEATLLYVKTHLLQIVSAIEKNIPLWLSLNCVSTGLIVQTKGVIHSFSDCAAEMKR